MNNLPSLKSSLHRKRRERLPRLPTTQSEVEFGGEWTKTTGGSKLLSSTPKHRHTYFTINTKTEETNSQNNDNKVKSLHWAAIQFHKLLQYHNTLYTFHVTNNHECLNMMLESLLNAIQTEKAPDPRLSSNIPRTASRQMRVGFHTLANTLTPPTTDY